MPVPDKVFDEGDLEEILGHTFSEVLTEVVTMHVETPGMFLGLSYVVNGKAYDLVLQVVGEHSIN